MNPVRPDPVSEKLKAMRGILKVRNALYVARSEALFSTVPTLKQIKVNDIPGQKPRVGAKRAREALEFLLEGLLSSSPRPNLGWNLDICIRNVDFDALEKKTGLKLVVSIKHQDPLPEYAYSAGVYRYFNVEATVTNAKLSLGKAMTEHRQAMESRKQELDAAKDRAKAALELVNLSMVEQLPVLVEAGLWSVQFPGLTFVDASNASQGRFLINNLINDC